MTASSCSAFTAVDLNPYLNHNGILWPGGQGEGDFDDFGRAFPAEDLPDGQAPFEIDGIPFLFPFLRPGEPNNVACEGQRLDVPQGHYRRAFVLGATACGSFREQVTLHFDDGEEQVVDLALSEFRVGIPRSLTAMQPPVFHEKTGLECNKVRRYGVDELAYHAVLWLQRMPILSTRILIRITLPDNPSVHLFALTLAHSFSGGGSLNAIDRSGTS